MNISFVKMEWETAGHKVKAGVPPSHLSDCVGKLDPQAAERQRNFFFSPSFTTIKSSLHFSFGGSHSARAELFSEENKINSVEVSFRSRALTLTFMRIIISRPILVGRKMREQTFWCAPPPLFSGTQSGRFSALKTSKTPPHLPAPPSPHHPLIPLAASPRDFRSTMQGHRVIG